MKYRKDRLNSLIREELSKIILREMYFENALVTITEVESADDLEYATVNVSVLPAAKSEKVLEELNNRHNFLFHLLRKKIRINMLPDIRFKIDTGIEQAAKIEKILIEEENKNPSIEE